MNNEYHEENPYALSIGDLMAALLLIFILLLAATLLKLQDEFESKSKIAEEYKAIQDDLYADLFEEFKYDLSKWSAEIDRLTLSIRFKEPDVLFERGSSEIRQRFLEILNEFFPRYINVLIQPKYKNNIEEIRIEGHTSSEGLAGDENLENAYFYNMKLSQDRTRSVLKYVLNTIENEDNKLWTKFRVTANGLSSSKLILYSNGTENKEVSRRVEFRVRTNAEEIIREMLRLAQELE